MFELKGRTYPLPSTRFVGRLACVPNARTVHSYESDLKSPTRKPVPRTVTIINTNGRLVNAAAVTLAANIIRVLNLLFFAVQFGFNVAWLRPGKKRQSARYFSNIPLLALRRVLFSALHSVARTPDSTRKKGNGVKKKKKTNT